MVRCGGFERYAEDVKCMCWEQIIWDCRRQGCLCDRCWPVYRKQNYCPDVAITGPGPLLKGSWGKNEAVRSQLFVFSPFLREALKGPKDS